MAKLPHNFNDREMRARIRELAGMLAEQCPTKLGVAFIAAEMLFHMGRGMMAAEIADGKSSSGRLAVTDYAIALGNLPIFEAPSTPTRPSIVEDLFQGFVKSIANHDPMLKRENWKTQVSQDRDDVCAYAFLMGNIAWQLAQNGGSAKVRRSDVEQAFNQVQAQWCSSSAQPGQGPYCDWMPF